MAKTIVKYGTSSLYSKCCVVLTTKHQKSIAISPSFEKILGADVLEYVVDTDTLGTFSGEIERKGSALDCVRKKCQWSIKKVKADYAIASEGSFGTHPSVPFIPSNREILYFIDKKREFHLYVTDIYTETNYQTGSFCNFEEVKAFAKKALFPSHALIVRPAPRENNNLVFKGIMNEENLKLAVQESLKASIEKKVWIETDMRAHVNPTRMKMIGRLADILANRLSCLCPSCRTPGWGHIKSEIGLPCSRCGIKTEEINKEIYGCTKCQYKETLPASHGKNLASPEYCFNCNP